MSSGPQMSKNVDLVRSIAPDIPFTVRIIIVAPIILVAITRIFNMARIADKMSCYAFERKPKEATWPQILVYCNEFPANVIVAAGAYNHLPRKSREPTWKWLFL